MGMIAERVSVAEYLEREVLADARHTYYDGTVFEMAGESVGHSVLAVNLMAEMRGRVRRSDWSVFGCNLRFQSGTGRMISYADVLVARRPVEMAVGLPDVVQAPVFLAEVLSPSTAAFDRGEKAEEYRRSPTVQAYAFLLTDRPKVELYARSEYGSWLVSDVEGLEAELALECLQCRIPMAALYEGVLGEPENLTQS